MSLDIRVRNKTTINRFSKPGYNKIETAIVTEADTQAEIVTEAQAEILAEILIETQAEAALPEEKHHKEPSSASTSQTRTSGNKIRYSK